MAAKDKHMNRPVPLWLVLIISVFVFLGGAIGGILFCAHYATPSVGADVRRCHRARGDAGQIKALEQEVNPIAMAREDQTSLELVQQYRAQVQTSTK